MNSDTAQPAPPPAPPPVVAAPQPGAMPPADAEAAPPHRAGAARKSPARLTAQQLIQMCRRAAIAHGLMGPERRHSVVACVRAERPDVAARMVGRGNGPGPGWRGEGWGPRGYGEPWDGPGGYDGPGGDFYGPGPN